MRKRQWTPNITSCRNGTWDLTRVRPKRQVADEARRAGKKVNFGRVFGLGTIKGSELTKGHNDRRHKGRYVFDGRHVAVRDEVNATAVFQDRGSSPATIEASKLVDCYGLIDSNDEEVSDAPQAYTQSKLRGVDT